MLAGRELQGRMEAVGANKASMPVARSFTLAVLAGAFIGFGGTFMLVVKADSTLSYAVSQLAGGLAFCLGLFLVLVAGAELFTGNCLMAQGALSGRYSLGALVRSWAVVYAGNAVGAVALALLLAAGGFLSGNGGAVGDAAVSVAATKASLAPACAFVRGILCNVLVCLAVWCGTAGESVCDKLVAALLPVSGFVAMGFEHSVANLFFLPLDLIAAAAGYGSASVAVAGVASNLVFVTLGNLVGGVAVAFAYWFAYRQRPRKAVGNERA